MKTAVIILDILTGILLFSTLVCGLWMRAQPQVDPSSIKFHMSVGIPAALFAAARSGVAWLRLPQGRAFRPVWGTTAGLSWSL